MIVWVIRVFDPIVSAVRWLVRLILRCVGVQTDPDSHILAVREEIAGALWLGQSEGVVEKEDRDRILGALDLSDRAVEEVMIHRSRIQMLDVEARPQDILSQCLASNHTRLPLYEGDPDNIVGIVHAKDLLRAIHKLAVEGDNSTGELDDFDVRTIAREPYFIPETTTLDEQMRQFLRMRSHFALVVDEYGALQGLITLEDILEEIVGEIVDESDEEEEFEIRVIDDDTIDVDGRVMIDDVNDLVHWDLPESDDYETVAGWVLHHTGMIPTAGHLLNVGHWEVEVLHATNRKIEKMRIRRTNGESQRVG